MSEQNVVLQLRSIADMPIDPARHFADDLWRRLEPEFDFVRSPTPRTEPVTDEGTSADGWVVQSTSKRSLRHPAWAAAAAFALVLGIGLFVGWLLLPGSSDVVDTGPTNPAFTATGPVDLSEGDVLWPANDMAGTPASVAEAFAVEVLGWSRADATETERGTCLTFPGRGTEFCPTNATTVTLAQDGVDPLELVLVTIGISDPDELWAVAQVGSGYTADLLETVDAGARIPLPKVEEAVQADITMRLADVNELVEVRAALADLNAGYLDTSLVSDPEQVLSVLIRYRDTNGHVLAAAGGPWNEFYEWPETEPAGPEVIIAEGTYLGSTDDWQMSAFITTDGYLCLQIGGIGCIGDIPSDGHLGALLTDSGFESGQEARWCAYGTSRDAASVQLRLPDGTQTAAPIFSNPDFEFDFYAFCSLGDRPPIKVSALDSNGNIIDVIPDTISN